MRLLRGYNKRLRDAIQIAIAYVDEVIDEMPAPLELSPKTFVINPQVKAYFASAQEFQNELSNDQQARIIARQLVDAQDEYVYLGLAMEVAKKTVFVPSLQGELIQREVARTAVNFSEHRYIDPSHSEQSLRRKIKKRVFMTLVQCALEELSQIQQQKTELQQQRSIMRAKLAQIKSHALGLEAFTQSIEHETLDYEKLHAKLTETEAKLKKISASIATLDEYLEIVNGVMAHPKNYVKVENTSVRITRMNLIAATTDEDPGEEIIFTRFESSVGENRVGRLIKYPRVQLLR